MGRGVRPVRLSIVGLGTIGKLHADRIRAHPDLVLVSVSDLTNEAEMVATLEGLPNRRDYREIVSDDPEGVVIAVPNGLHREVGEYFAEQHIHLMVEKPIAESVAAGRHLIASAEMHGVQLLVGHHRRHNTLVVAAQALVRERLGKLVATNTLVTMKKPDSYYGTEWRRQRDAGPLVVNAVHEIDTLRAICGEIEAVQAQGRNTVRRFDFDDNIAAVLHFASGALGTITVADSTPSPWSWEASVAEGLGFPTYPEANTVFLGTKGSLSFPRLDFWSYAEDIQEPGWWAPLSRESLAVEENDPYRAQLEHFARVVRGEGAPLVSGAEALASLAVVEAIGEAARTGRVVPIRDVLGQEPPSLG